MEKKYLKYDSLFSLTELNAIKMILEEQVEENEGDKDSVNCLKEMIFKINFLIKGRKFNNN